MGGGAFIIARWGIVYVTPGPYLPIAKSRYEGLLLLFIRNNTGIDPAPIARYKLHT